MAHSKGHNLIALLPPVAERTRVIADLRRLADYASDKVWNSDWMGHALRDAVALLRADADRQREAVLAEREACAKIAETYPLGPKGNAYRRAGNVRGHAPSVQGDGVRGPGLADRLDPDVVVTRPRPWP